MNDLKGSRILVTGGAGFIGSTIVDQLIDEGVKEVVIFDNMVRGKKENIAAALKTGKAKLFRGDITKPRDLDRAMKGIDYVFHEAALWLLTCEEHPRQAIDVNIIGTYNVLEACVKHKVKKICSASSSSVYGDGLYFPTDETHPFNNYLFYGATKVADEQLHRAFWKKHGLDYVCFRYLNVYGPRQDYRSVYISVIMNFINKIAAGEAPVINGDGSATLDLIYVGEIARENILAMKSDVTNECFNGASGKETSLKELLNILIKLLDAKDVEPVYQERDAKLVTRRFGSAKKAKEMLGFECKVTPEEGLQKVIDWWKADQTGASRK